MPILYEDKDVIITQGFFTGWKIQMKATGTIIKPTFDTKVAMGAAWMKVAKRDGFSKVSRRLATDHLMLMFAQACVYPNSPEAHLFNTMQDYELVKTAYHEHL